MRTHVFQAIFMLQKPYFSGKTGTLLCVDCHLNSDCDKIQETDRGERKGFAMDNVKFGKFIRKSRREKNMTQKQLAERLNVSDKAVSKWENGIGFPDIKLLEPLANCLGVSLLELMQGERNEEEQIERKEAGQVVADAISQSEKLEERRITAEKIKLLLTAGGLGALYLVFVGISFVLKEGQREGRISAVCQSGVWYENPVVFYVWVGIFVIGCVAAAFFLLWKTQRLPVSGVRIGRHRVKGFLTILMDMVVVIMLHTYMADIASNMDQLKELPQAIPVTAWLSNKNGSMRTQIDIKDDVVRGLENSAYVKELNLTVHLKAGTDRVDPGDWSTLSLFLCGVNRIEAAGGIREESIVWNTGKSASIFRGKENLCVVSKKLFDKKGWKLGEKINLCQYYYYRGGAQNKELFMAPLEDAVYEIAGYADIAAGMKGKEGVTPPDILVPFATVREAHYRQGIPFMAHSADFEVKDSLHLNEFKDEMKSLGLRSIAPLSVGESYDGDALNVNDSVFISTASRLRQLIDTAKAFYPVLLALIVSVGYLVTLLLLQSRRREMALLRSVGISRWGCFFIFFREQFLLTVCGVLTGSLFAVLLHGNYGGSSVLTGCVVGICYIAGNSLALWRLLKVSVMEALVRVQ